MENRPHRKDGNGSRQWIRKFYSRCTKKAALPFRCDYDNHCFQRSSRFSARDVWRWLEINAKCLKIAKRLFLKNFVRQLRLAQKKAPIRSIHKPLPIRLRIQILVDTKLTCYDYFKESSECAFAWLAWKFPPTKKLSLFMAPINQCFNLYYHKCQFLVRRRNKRPIFGKPPVSSIQAVAVCVCFAEQLWRSFRYVVFPNKETFQIVISTTSSEWSSVPKQFIIWI